MTARPLTRVLLTGKQRTVYEAICGAVEAGAPCPVNTALRRLTGHRSTSSIDAVFKVLEGHDMIVVYRVGSTRVVLIRALRRSTTWADGECVVLDDDDDNKAAPIGRRARRTLGGNAGDCSGVSRGEGPPQDGASSIRGNVSPEGVTAGRDRHPTESAPCAGNGFSGGAPHASNAEPATSMGAAAAADRGRTSGLRKPAGKRVGGTAPEDVTAGETALFPIGGCADLAARSSTPGPIAAPKDCQWPIGEPGQAGFHFCHKATVPEKPYCADHCAKAYVKPKPRAGRTASESIGPWRRRALVA